MDVIITLINRLTSWPVAIFILAGWLFRPQVKDFLVEIRTQLPRVRKAGPVGIELDAIEKQKDEGPNPAANVILPMRLTEPPPSDAVRLLEEGLVENLQTIPDAERVSGLVRQLATIRVQAGHEYVYNRIFDSQLFALRGLNTAANVSMQNARDFLATYCSKNEIPPDSLKFEQWLHFLTSNGLIEIHEDSITITTFGRDFLVYVVNQRLPEVKGIL